MYPYHVLFSEDRGAAEGERFWFQDALHGPEPVHPFDFVWWNYAVPALNQASSRLFVVPPSLGSENRVLNGYVYVSANSVTDEETLARRAELFSRRGGYYFQHWDEIHEHWVKKVEQTTRELELLEVPELPEYED